MQEIRWMTNRLKASTIKQVRQWRKDFNNWKRFWQSYRQYQKMAVANKKATINYLYPCLDDNTAQTFVEPTYFYQDTWAFEKIVQQAPQNHIDVGSHHKFVALLSKVVPVTMVDIRPLSLPLNTLSFKEGSILGLPFENNSVISLSSLCVVEHIGLGRYGDPLDPDGSEKAIAELCRVLAPGGKLYLSVPVGDKDIVAFNAGRIFSLDYLYQLLNPLMVVDHCFIVGNTLQEGYEFRARFGTTGLFELTKPAP